MDDKGTGELARALAESLAARGCFGCTASHESCVRAFWKAAPQSFAGDGECVILFVALDENRRAAMKDCVDGQKDSAVCSQIQVTTPKIMETLRTVDADRFARMLDVCRRVIMWIHPDDLRGDADAMQDWFRLIRTLPGLDVAYLCVPPQGKPRIASVHPEVRWIEEPADKSSCIPAVFLLASDRQPKKILDPSFWKSCRRRHTLVTCESTVHSLQCEEAAHHFHVPTARGGSSREPEPRNGPADSGRPDELVVFVPDAHVDFLPRRRAWDHYAVVDPALYDGPCETLAVRSPKARSLIASSRFSLLNLLAATREDGCSQGAPDDWEKTVHTSVCDDINRERLGFVRTDFLLRYACAGPQPGFLLGGHAVQCESFDPVARRAVLRGSCGTGSFWIDALPVCCSAARARAMYGIIFNDDPVPGVILVGETGDELDRIRAQFVGFKDEFRIDPQSWIEIVPDGAKWWTFAGAQNNALLATMLNREDPKLDISFGNLNLYLRWPRSRASVRTHVRRMRQHRSKMEAYATNGMQDDLQQIYELWRNRHPRDLWSFLPDCTHIGAFEHILDRWRQTFISPAVLEVRALNELDPLPTTGCGPCRNESDAPAQPVVTVSPQPTAAAAIPGMPSPIEPGDGSFMRTRLPRIYICDTQTLASAINVMLAQTFIGLDVETTLYDHRLCLIQIGCTDRTYIIDPLRVNFSGLSQVFSNPNLIKVIHNSTFECQVLDKYGMQILNIADTLKISRHIHGMKCPGGHSLRAVCLREFGYDMDKTCQTSRWDKRPLSDEQFEYAALDAEILVHLYLHFSRR